MNLQPSMWLTAGLKHSRQNSDNRVPEQLLKCYNNEGCLWFPWIAYKSAMCEYWHISGGRAITGIHVAVSTP